MGLGSYPDISLADARESARQARRLKASGVDPLDDRRTLKAKKTLEAAKAVTFRKCAEEYIAGRKIGWKNKKHAGQWSNTLGAYAYPFFGHLPVQAVDVTLVHKALSPIWETKTETASRVRGRIEAVLDWAKVRGYRSGENPARWKGHLENLFPSRTKVHRVEHHAALPYDEIGTFMRELRQNDTQGSRALQFTILTACRTGEALSAEWSEFDLVKGVWTIPAGRMKAGREHRVPLSASALKLLETIAAEAGESLYVFPGATASKPVSKMTMLQLLKRMGRPDVTVHGFRSAFRDWAAEQTAFPSEVAEIALAHTLANKVEAAYRRGDMFERRRRMMNEWASYCSMPASLGGAELLQLRASG